MHKKYTRARNQAQKAAWHAKHNFEKKLTQANSKTQAVCVQQDYGQGWG